MTGQRRLYNAAIAYIRCPTGVPVLCCSLTNAEKNLKYYQETGKEVKGYQWRPENFFSTFKPYQFWTALCQENPWDHRGLTKDGKPSCYGVCSATLTVMHCALIKTISDHFGRIKEGKKSTLPSQFRKASDENGWRWDIKANRVRVKNGQLHLGAKTQYVGVVSVHYPSFLKGKDLSVATV